MLLTWGLLTAEGGKRPGASDRGGGFDLDLPARHACVCSATIVINGSGITAEYRCR